MFTLDGGDVDPARERLARVMNARRLELGIRWREVAQRAGMTEQNLIKIRKGVTSLTEDAGAAVERALRWQAGSVAAVLTNSEPTPLVGPASQPTGARWESYRVTPEKALNLLAVALEDYGPGGFWQAFDRIVVDRESRENTLGDVIDPRSSGTDQSA